MAKTKKARTKQRQRYGFFYPEGPGYLHLNDIDPGTQGSVALVLSCADKQVYVRKRGKTIYCAPGGYPLDYGCDEVFYHRIHKLIPRLVDWTIYRPLSRVNPGYLENASTSTIWEFCRGGDLRSLVDIYTSQNRHGGHGITVFPLKHHIPEAFIWKALGQLIQVLTFIHHAHPPVCHLDIFMGNVFMRPVSGSQLPDCCLGDFGKATLLDTNLQDDGTRTFAEPRSARRLIVDDYNNIIMIAKQLMTLQYQQRRSELQVNYLRRMDALFDDLELAHTRDLAGVQETKNGRAALHSAMEDKRAKFQATIADGFDRYTPLLFDTIRQLEKKINGVTSFAQVDISTGNNIGRPSDTVCQLNLSYLGEAIERRAQDRLEAADSATYPAVGDYFRQQMHRIEFDFAEDDLRLQTMFSKDQIIDSINRQRPVGPFRIARLDPKTLAVTGISRKTYHTFDFVGVSRSQEYSDLEGVRENSEHSVAHDPMQMSNTLVTRNLSYGTWAQQDGKT